MDIFLHIVSSFSLQLFIAELMFCLFLEKRKYFLAVLLPLSALFIGLTFELPFYTLFGVIPVRFFLTFLLSIGLLLACFKPVRAVLFCAAAGFLVRVFAQNLYVLYNYFFTAPVTHEKYDAAYYLIFLAAYVACFFLYAIRLKKHPDVAIGNSRILPILFLVIFINELLGIWLYALELPNNPIVTIYGLLCSTLALLLQFQFFREKKLNEQNAVYEELLCKEREQYALSKQNIDLLNMKCHDIKHMLAILQEKKQSNKVEVYCRELAETAAAYDETPQTGNTALDVTIAEVRGAFRLNGINFSYTADGKLLNILNDTDIYSLFGNILRNALNGSLAEKDEQNRSARLLVCGKAGGLYIHEDNGCSEPVRFIEGLPQTSGDQQFHGFGTRSIVYTVQKYGGTVRFSQQEQRFCVDIFISLHEQ